MTLTLSLRSLAWFGGLFIFGSLACLPLFRGDWRRLLNSSLWTKIVWWWPIFGWLVGILWLGRLAAGLTVIMMAFLALRELRRQRWLTTIAWLYAGVTIVLFASLPFYWPHPGDEPSRWLLAVCFSSALSDIAAFFGGRYLGRHKLPASLNPNKAWEGVGGQIIGGAFGWMATVALLALGLPWWPGIVIGLASAAGDLSNSYVKRQLDIPDWGNSIPGHGGVLDRFSSLSVALAAGLLLMIVLN